MSCNTTEFAQDFSPDNEIAIAVDPTDPDHLVAGSNDYFYRFNNSTGARQVYVPTGFFTSFDGGATWQDGQVPMRSGNGAGDPAPAFDRKHGAVLMAQLENTGGQGATGSISQGDVSVSHSTDGGVTWSEPVDRLPRHRHRHRPRQPGHVLRQGMDHGRQQSRLAALRPGVRDHDALPERSPRELRRVADRPELFGRRRAAPGRRRKEISGSHPSCTFQSSRGAATECDEDQFSIPEVASDGTLYVHFANFQNEAAWEPNDLFDSS